MSARDIINAATGVSGETLLSNEVYQSLTYRGNYTDTKYNDLPSLSTNFTSTHSNSYIETDVNVSINSHQVFCNEFIGFGDGEFYYNDKKYCTIDSDGNTYVALPNKVSSSSATYVLIAKFNSSGVLQWKNQLFLGSFGSPTATAVGGIICSPSPFNEIFFHYDRRTFKINKITGSIDWSYYESSLTSLQLDRIEEGIAATAEYPIMLYGFGPSSAPTGRFATYHPATGKDSTYQFNTTSFGFSAVANGSGRALYLAGSEVDGSGNTYGRLVKITNGTTVNWSKEIYGTDSLSVDYGVITSMKLLSSGSLVIIGSLNAADTGYSFYAKISGTDGSLQSIQLGSVGSLTSFTSRQLEVDSNDRIYSWNGSSLIVGDNADTMFSSASREYKANGDILSVKTRGNYVSIVVRVNDTGSLGTFRRTVRNTKNPIVLLQTHRDAFSASGRISVSSSYNSCVVFTRLPDEQWFQNFTSALTSLPAQSFWTNFSFGSAPANSQLSTTTPTATSIADNETTTSVTSPPLMKPVERNNENEKFALIFHDVNYAVDAYCYFSTGQQGTGYFTTLTANTSGTYTSGIGGTVRPTPIVANKGISFNKTQTTTDNSENIAFLFKQKKKFFDIVSYVGNGTTGRVLNHNLGVEPGFALMQVIGVSSTPHNRTWHTGFGTTLGSLLYDTTAPTTTGGSLFSAAPTSNTITVNNNVSGTTYHILLFANDQSSNSISKSGTYVGGTTPLEVNLGFEPEVVFIKSNSTGSWIIVDRKTGGGKVFQFNQTGSAVVTGRNIIFTKTGFIFTDSYNAYNTTAVTFYYYALGKGYSGITSSRDFFQLSGPSDYTAGTSTDGNLTGQAPYYNQYFKDLDSDKRVNFSPDFVLVANKLSGTKETFFAFKGMSVATYDTPFISSTSFVNSNVSVFSASSGVNGLGSLNLGTFPDPSVCYMFKAYPGLSDCSIYLGNGSTKNITHGLGVIPELVIIKNISTTPNSNWVVGGSVMGSSYLLLNSNAAETTNSTIIPTNAYTSSTITVGSSAFVNTSGSKYVCYSFASKEGFIKIGAYTGDGTNARVINCGFTSGSRFVLLKTKNTSGSWIIWDTLRGIVSENDPYLTLEGTTSQVTTTDWIDPATSGFAVNSEVNTIGVDYIYMAIA